MANVHCSHRDAKISAENYVFQVPSLSLYKFTPHNSSTEQCSPKPHFRYKEAKTQLKWSAQDHTAVGNRVSICKLGQ